MWNRTAKTVILFLVLHVFHVHAQAQSKNGEVETSELQNVNTTEQPETSTLMMRMMQKAAKPRKGVRGWLKKKGRKLATRIKAIGLAKAKKIFKNSGPFVTEMSSRIVKFIEKLEQKEADKLAQIGATKNKPKKWYKRAVASFVKRLSPQKKAQFKQAQVWLAKQKANGRKKMKILSTHAKALYKDIMKIDANDKITFETEKKRLAELFAKHGKAAWNEVKKKDPPPGVVLPTEEELKKAEEEKKAKEAAEAAAANPTDTPPADPPEPTIIVNGYPVVVAPDP